MRLFLVLLFLFVSSAIAYDNFDKVIYGKDGRLDTYAVTNPMLLQLASATSALIPNGNLTQKGDYFIIEGEQSMASMNLCPSERFAYQTASAICSGFLVAPDLMVTAGHCIKNASDCSANKFVFGYVAINDTTSIDKVPAKDVYACKKVIAQELNNNTKADYSLVQLDRKVTDRKPITYRKTGKIDNKATLVLIGHPSGLPQKISVNAMVRNNNFKSYFVSNTDSYGGNSGSPVFDAKTGQLEGILVRGEQDYAINYSEGCYVSKICTDTGCRGEDITRITLIQQLMK